ncbi:MAG TPA: IS110 family transposase [Myxococcales bacterium]|jgi:transposase
MVEDTLETIGCDLGDKLTEIFVLGPGGEGRRPKPIKTTRAGMQDFFAERPRAHVVIEVGQHSRWVKKQLTELGHKVTVANPNCLKVISQSNSKRDRRDAEMLARLGRADIKLLAPVQHRCEQAQADLAVLKARDTAVRCRTKFVNLARLQVKSFGERLPVCDAAAFHKKTWASVPELLKPALKPIFKLLAALDREIKTYDKTIARVAKRYPDVEVLSQPDGVGLLTALAFLLTIDDKKRFAKSRTVGAYIGLRPKLDQSGDIDKQLHITKAGDHFLRRLLVGSANYILGPFAKDSDLRRWGSKLSERGGKNAKRRATVAVARKLAVLLHRLWVTGEVYEPIGYGSKEKNAG